MNSLRQKWHHIWWPTPIWRNSDRFGARVGDGLLHQNGARYNIDVHDYSVRLKAARRFLKDGDKVKVIVNLKGRENEFRNKAIELLRRFQNDIGELGIEENKDFRDRNIFVVLVPNKAVAQRSQEPAGKKDNPSESEVSAGV
ncbi:Translation initiation factor 3 protein isoform 1 [Dorcoceras hygrometricum]|uniref:Translation initiation factor 3 protein isoform 1 n=1 Tax=Dorcoceras hygrometricum TaxID=472368 RepID=A0A2Z7A9B9_9LAMI|nr:Translation initiation factor 3 protein isoform 1 [Dorcoceras hygrometricum]